MQTTSFPIIWGNMTLVLDHRAFEVGYVHGRQYYFEVAWEEQEKDGLKEALTSSHLLGLIAVRDERGCYQLDDGCNKSAFPDGVEELLGVRWATSLVPYILKRTRNAQNASPSVF